MTPSLVSIIIPCCNCERYVGNAITSALNQTYPRKEVIVVDDGSADNSLDVIKSFGSAVQWVSQRNCGAAAARNAGLDLARGELIQFLDADDLMHPDKIHRQVGVLGSGRDAAVFCNADVQQCTYGRRVAVWGAPSPTVSDPVVFVLQRALQTAMPLHWKHNLLAVGGFRADMPPCEDPDLHLRLACVGVRFLHIPESLLVLRRFPGSLSTRDPAGLRRLEMRMAMEAYDKLQESARMSATRVEAFAGFLAKVARRCIRDGSAALATECFRLARQIHPEGGIPQAYGGATRRLYHLIGPSATERLVTIKRRISGVNTVE